MAVKDLYSSPTLIKFLSFFLILTFRAIHVFPQNLVPNSDFECGIDNCTGTSTAWVFENDGYACQWNSPTFGTPDIFSTELDPSCWAALPDVISFPYNVGTQVPRSGKRVAGLHIYGTTLLLQEWREYLQVGLNEQLVPGEHYCGEVYVSLAEGAHMASSNFGMAFVETQIGNYLIHDHLPLVPEIFEPNIITNSINWVKVSGSFVAGSPANYLMLGNFHSDAETQVINDMTGGLIHSAYYFIDDVSVERVPNSSLVFSGNVDICKGDSVAIHATAGTHYVEWSDLDDPSHIIHVGTEFRTKPEKTRSYLAKAKGCGIETMETITVNVRQTPEIDLPENVKICPGTSLILDAGANHLSYLWNDLTESQFLTVNDIGTYSVKVRNNLNCESSDTIHVSRGYPPSVDIGRDTVVCDQLFPIVARTSGNDITYQWSDGSTDSIFLPLESGKYWLTVVNECGTETDSIQVYSGNDIFVPNVLTLNGDTLNSKLMIKGISSDQMSMLTIFNRWGRQVYSSKNYRGDWPDREQDLVHGMYYYVLSYPGCRDYKGWVHILK